jgi:hypothetical protein
MCLGEWRQDLQVVMIVGSASVGGGVHECGDWEVASRGQ